MAWRGPRTPNDPLLTSHHWRVVIRGYWKSRRLPCSVCKRMIDYDGPRYLTTITGRRTLNPRYLIVGHIVSRNVAKRLGWTDQQINALSNTRQECQSCSNSSGAREGQRAQRVKVTARAALDTSRRW